MGGDSRFWYLFGGIWLVVGVCFVAASLGVNLFADPAALNQDAPLWVFVAVGLAASVAGGSIIYFARKTAVRDRRLILSGVEASATVTDIRRSMIDINRQVRWHVVYRYEDANGRKLRGESRALPGEDVQGFRPGDSVKIKIDPQKSEESLFLGSP